MLPFSGKGLYQYRGRDYRDFSLHGVSFGNQELNVKKVEVEIKSLKSLLQFMREKVYPLHAAATHGRIDSVKKLLSIGELCNEPDDRGFIPIHYAAYSGRIDIVKALLHGNSSINQPDDEGVSPLHFAIYSGHIDLVKVLLKSGAIIDQPDDKGICPLHVAAEHDHISIVKILLSSNAPVNQRSEDGSSALHYASEQGNLDIAIKLLRSGAEVNGRDNSGFTPLMRTTLMMSTPGINDTAFIKLNILAFELVKNNASVTKLDVAILSKFAIINSRISNNAYLELLWERAELHNSKNVEELFNFEVTEFDLDRNPNEYRFSEKNGDNLINGSKGLSSRVKIRKSTLVKYGLNWHHILLDSFYDSDTNQTIAEKIIIEKKHSKLPVWSGIRNLARNFRARYFSTQKNDIISVENVTFLEPLDDRRRFHGVYAELISLLDKDLQSVTWAQLYEDSRTVVDANVEAEIKRDLEIQNDMIAQLAAKGYVEAEGEEEIMENINSEYHSDRYFALDEQSIAPQKRVDAIEFTEDAYKWRDRVYGRFVSFTCTSYSLPH